MKAKEAWKSYEKLEKALVSEFIYPKKVSYHKYTHKLEIEGVLPRRNRNESTGKAFSVTCKMYTGTCVVKANDTTVSLESMDAVATYLIELITEYAMLETSQSIREMYQDIRAARLALLEAQATVTCVHHEQNGVITTISGHTGSQHMFSVYYLARNKYAVCRAGDERQECTAMAAVVAYIESTRFGGLAQYERVRYQNAKPWSGADPGGVGRDDIIEQNKNSQGGYNDHLVWFADMNKDTGARWYPPEKRTAVAKVLMMQLEWREKSRSVSRPFNLLIRDLGRTLSTQLVDDARVITEFEMTGWLTKEGQEMLRDHMRLVYLRKIQKFGEDIVVRGVRVVDKVASTTLKLKSMRMPWKKRGK